MGVPLRGLPTNSRPRRELQSALCPQDALPLSLLFLSQFLPKCVRITHVRVSVCESGQQPLGTLRARCAGTPKPSLLVGCRVRLRGSLVCHRNLRIRSRRLTLAGPQRGCILGRGSCDVSSLNTWEKGKESSITRASDAFLESSVMCGCGI